MAAYWTLNKKTDVGAVYSNLQLVSEAFKIPKDTLYHHFSRLKKKEYSNEEVRVIKCQIIKSNNPLK